MIKACLFSLDGVIVDTARCRFLAWKRLAAELGFEFTELQNESLRGVSRFEALGILLRAGGLTGRFDAGQKVRMASCQAVWYREYVERMTEADVLPGAVSLLEGLRREGISVGLGSAGRDAPAILERTGIRSLFDCVFDGSLVSYAKSDPEPLLQQAALLGADPSECVAFDCEAAGIEAALKAGMRSVGVGDPCPLREATVVTGFARRIYRRRFAVADPRAKQEVRVAASSVLQPSGRHSGSSRKCSGRVLPFSRAFLCAYRVQKTGAPADEELRPFMPIRLETVAGRNREIVVPRLGGDIVCFVEFSRVEHFGPRRSCSALRRSAG